MWARWVCTVRVEMQPARDGEVGMALGGPGGTKITISSVTESCSGGGLGREQHGSEALEPAAGLVQGDRVAARRRRIRWLRCSAASRSPGSNRHARAGHYMMAISSIDAAPWGTACRACGVVTAAITSAWARASPVRPSQYGAPTAAARPSCASRVTPLRRS